ncbi:cytochrome c oxidase accessory protein CcoG [Pseudomethylobacillus aquaticus]|uniref:Cytochrome c oxidase accessory protein CcoG n=1 Tax=Pseudomethylobacillus aquaticus TaxID=2676064 RepID=A0A3N0UW77_9PROT|nr:cytochrome c oxidase accessory protein CcoG [Pseudomethylobacillus aquaticus]ROH84504.1 cytochrome c oxidase accessory protein CcoG [Pseudomethylobacillus aquaticus]
MPQTGAAKPSSLLHKQIPIVTRSVKGKFRNFKTAVMVVAYSIYFLLPWMPWQRNSAADQAVMFDLESRRFFIFDLIVYPQDIFWLAMLLFIAAALLFFTTGLIGRAWCGYFCFQTLWSDLFIFIERMIQGERPARLRLMKQPLGAEKILKIGGSHALMILVSLWTAVTFAAYFSYAPDFVIALFTGHAVEAAYITVGVLTLTTYFAAGVIREHVCTLACPYARFQGVMYEADTLAVSYDSKRGEGLKGRTLPIIGLKTRDERQEKGHGDCIDCGFCVQVCPTGIDIRDGLQYQCISCGLCIDACNNIMDSVGYPRGLIRYDSEKNLSSDQPKPARLEWKRVKVIGYATALLIAAGILLYNIGTRNDTDVSVQQVRQPLFIMLSDGSYRNRYQVHIVNKTELDARYQLSVRGIPASSLDLGSLKEVRVRAGKSLIMNAKVDLERTIAQQTEKFEFVVTSSNPDTAPVVVPANFNSQR